MHLLIVILITYSSANMLEPVFQSRQLKDFASAFNNFLQPDFKATDPVPYSEEINRINVIYKTVEEPVRIDKIIPVPIVKHIPQPVPVYVPQPYPVEKKIFVPYKIYEKQHIPIVHRYPVVKEIPVPLQEMQIPFHVSTEKRVDTYIPKDVPQFSTETKELFLSSNNSSKTLSALSREVPFQTEDFANFTQLNTAKFSADDISNLTKETDHYIFKKKLVPYLVYPTDKIIPFGARISAPTSKKNIEHENKGITKEYVENSSEINLITVTPEYIEHSEPHKTTSTINESVKYETATKHNQTDIREVKDNVKETDADIIFSKKRNDIDLSGE